MNLPKSLGAAALVAALAIPTTAQAAAPWTEPAAVAGSSGQSAGAPNVLFTNTRGGAIAFNAPGSFPGAPLLRSVDGAAAAEWPGAVNFDSTFGAFAAADRIIYAGSDGERRVNVAIAPGPGSEWRVEKRGPQTGGARVATAAAPKHTVAAFSTFGAGDIGSVYVVRQSGVGAPGATERISGKGHIRSVAVAVNASGDVLAAWDRSGTIESRMYYGGSRHWGAVIELGEVTGALHITAAIGADRRAIVGWTDQLINEGGTGQRGDRVGDRPQRQPRLPAAREAARGVPGHDDPGRHGDQGGLHQRRPRDHRLQRPHRRPRGAGQRPLIRAPQDLAPIAPDESQADPGLYDLAVSPDGRRSSRWSPPSTAATTRSWPRRWPPAHGPSGRLRRCRRRCRSCTSRRPGSTRRRVGPWSPGRCRRRAARPTALRCPSGQRLDSLNSASYVRARNCTRGQARCLLNKGDERHVAQNEGAHRGRGSSVRAAGHREREPTVDAAKAIYQDLGLTQLLDGIPSGRVVEPTATAATNFGYRTYEEINAELQALANANPGFVKIKTAAAKSVRAVTSSTWRSPTTSTRSESRPSPCSSTWA